MLRIDHLNLWYLQALVVDLAIIVFLFLSLRFFKSLLLQVKAKDEIAEKDNFAFSISFAGGIFALAIMLTGVSAGEFKPSLSQEALSTSGFGIFGILLIIIGRFFQDKVFVRNINLHDQVKSGNVAAAVVDVGNMIAIGVVVRGTMLWVQTEGLAAVPVILFSWLISQIVLGLAATYRLMRFANVSKGEENTCLQKAFEQGNVGLSIRYAGYIVGTAWAITAASGMVYYVADQVWLAAAAWGGVSALFAVVFAIIVILTRRLLLPGVDVDKEVDKEKNIGVACIEASIFISIGIVLAALFTS
ncbi:MAG: DUF350 domain-containing protein [Pseudomonadota bacterium]